MSNLKGTVISGNDENRQNIFRISNQKEKKEKEK